MTLPITVTTDDKDLSKFLKLGVTECNWQLFESDLDDPIAALNHILSMGVRPVSLHTPFRERKTPLCIEYIEYDALLRASLRVCNTIGERLNQVIPTVCHTALPVENVWWAQAIKQDVDATLSDCPAVDLLIENGSVLPSLGCSVVESLKATTAVAKALSLGTCFDLCHATMVNRFGMLFRNHDVYDQETAYIEDILDVFADTCKLVHFANTRDYGVRRCEHGCGFDDKDTAAYLLSLIKSHLPNAKIVLEMSEADYTFRKEAYRFLQDMLI